MQCDEVRAQLLLPDDVGSERAVQQHLAQCDECAAFASNTAELDDLLASVVIVEPPLELQQQLTAIARAAARPQAVSAPVAVPVPAPQRERRGFFWWVPSLAQNRTALAQLVAGFAVALASWQMMGWLGGASDMLGNVPYAMELIVGSPALRYVADAPANLQSLALWSVVGLAGWSVSEKGPFGKQAERLSRLF